MKILPVNPFFQNDNDRWGNASGGVQCCPTSNAMLVAYLQPNLLVSSSRLGYSEFESFYKAEFERAGYASSDRGNHDAHTVCLEERFGIQSTWRMDLQPSEIRDSIDKDIPVVVGVDYGDSGHVFLIIGYSENGWVVNDPNGIRLGAEDEYAIINDGNTYAGAADFYGHEVAATTIFAGGSAWGRLVQNYETAIKPTQ